MTMLLKVCKNDFTYFFVILKTFRPSRKEMPLEYILMISSLEESGTSTKTPLFQVKWGLRLFRNLHAILLELTTTTQALK